MRWFGRRKQAAIPRRRFADIQALPPGQRRDLFAGAHGREWIEAAAQYGLVEAQVLLGQHSLDRGDATMAIRWFKAAGSAGYAPAINMAGRCFELGWGVTPNLAEAARHYRQAADLGLDWGQFNLANLLVYGLGVPRDRVQAYGWYHSAALQGLAKAMNMVGRFHEDGWDRPRNPAAAAAWYTRAAEAGDYRAQYNLGTLLAEQGRRLEAAAWFEKAVAHGDADFLAQAGAALRNSPDPVFQAIGQKVLGSQ